MSVSTQLAAMENIERVVIKYFVRPVTTKVTAVEHISPRFRRITLKSDALKSFTWSPGQKVDLAISDSVRRTYTPMNWDSQSGITQILVFVHGPAPGADWATSLAVGATCRTSGPKPSLDLRDLARPMVLFGDESSFGLAYSIRATEGGTRDATFIFEVSSAVESRTVLGALGIDGAILVERRPDDTHLAEAEATFVRAVQAQAPPNVVLTGKASSIQRMIRALKQRGLPTPRFKNKAYWATGKKGLD